MEIDKILKLSRLYDTYYLLLSEKQQNYMKNYIFDDLSLTEISENYGISKQAISNSIKRTILELEEFENKLNLISISSERNFLLDEIEKINTNKDINLLLKEIRKLDS